ncbi:MAG: hypothetical protein Q4G38_02565 [Aeriscardovia aeriphila]|nr:hypothetical protein [Aeriscardovia aeriphila]
MKRIIRDAAIVALLVLAVLAEYRLYYGEIASFATSPSLLTAIVGGLVCVFCVEYNSSHHQDQAQKLMQTRWEAITLAIASALALGFDIYAFTTKSLVFVASVISLLVVILLAALFSMTFGTASGVGSASAKGQEGRSLAAHKQAMTVRILAGICILCVCAGLVLLYVA